MCLACLLSSVCICPCLHERMLCVCVHVHIVWAHVNKVLACRKSHLFRTFEDFDIDIFTSTCVYVYIHACMHGAESCLFWHASIRGVQPHHTYVCVYLCVCVYIYIYGYRSLDLHTYKLHTVYIHAYRIYMHVRTHTRTLKLCVPCSRTTPLTHARTRTLSA